MADMEQRYALMTTDQAPAPIIAEWLRDTAFAAYVATRRNAR